MKQLPPWVLAALAFGLSPADTVRAQDPEVLIAAGRFEEAVALLNDADSASAESAAIHIFAQASEPAFESVDVARLRRAVTAAEQLPNLNPRIYFLVPGFDTPRLADDVRTYIRIQEAVIRRGR